MSSSPSDNDNPPLRRSTRARRAPDLYEPEETTFNDDLKLTESENEEMEAEFGQCNFNTRAALAAGGGGSLYVVEGGSDDSDASFEGERSEDEDWKPGVSASSGENSGEGDDEGDDSDASWVSEEMEDDEALVGSDSDYDSQDEGIWGSDHDNEAESSGYKRKKEVPTAKVQKAKRAKKTVSLAASAVAEGPAGFEEAPVGPDASEAVQGMMMMANQGFGGGQFSAVGAPSVAPSIAPTRAWGPSSRDSPVQVSSARAEQVRAAQAAHLALQAQQAEAAQGPAPASLWSWSPNQ